MKNNQTIIMLSLLFLPALLHGAQINVDATLGGVDGNDGLCSISEAIINANDDAQTHSDCVAGDGADTITLTNNVFLTEEYENDASWGRTGTPPINSIIILDGSDFSLSRFSKLLCVKNASSEVGEFRLLRITDSGNLDLRAVNLSNGCVDGANGLGMGGAILNDGLLVVSNSQIYTNRATNGGGINNTGSINLIENSEVSQNLADDGGGVQNLSLIGSIQNSILGGNMAVNDGGGIHNFFGQIQNIQHNIFIYNSARDGGAIDNTAFINLMQNNQFMQNSAINEGGGINNGSQSYITTFRNNTLIENSAFLGGGIYNGKEIITIENNTFSGNSASNLGGGILNSNDITTTQNNTFSGNTASQGGAIYNFSIFETALNNLFHDGSICHGFNPDYSSDNLADSTSTGCAESDVLTPSMVLPLSDNGCVTSLADGSCVMTHALISGSEAIDAASVIVVSQEDQRGYLANGIRDIGAYEYEGVIDLIFIDGFDTAEIVN